MKTSAWTDEERAEMAERRERDAIEAGAYEMGPDGKPLRVPSPLAKAFAASVRKDFGIFMRDLLEQATDVERALHRVASAGHLSHEQRSRLKGRVRYLMVQADMRKRDIDIEAVIAAEIRKETR